MSAIRMTLSFTMPNGETRELSLETEHGDGVSYAGAILTTLNVLSDAMIAEANFLSIPQKPASHVN
jgi:hypothetical protein